MKTRMLSAAFCLVLAACASGPVDPGVPTLDGSSPQALKASFSRMTEGMTRNEKEAIGWKLAMIIGSMACDPDEQPMSEEEMSEAFFDVIDELDGVTLDDIRKWQFDEQASERAAACGSWH